MTSPAPERAIFIREIVAARPARCTPIDGCHAPPAGAEWHLPIGHAKSICLNFGIAQEFGGTTTLHFDDTNPAREEQEIVDPMAMGIAAAISRAPRAAPR